MKVKLTEGGFEATLENGETLKAKKNETAAAFRDRVKSYVLDEFLANAVFSEDKKAPAKPVVKEEAAPAKKAAGKGSPFKSTQDKKAAPGKVSTEVPVGLGKGKAPKPAPVEAPEEKEEMYVPPGKRKKAKAEAPEEKAPAAAEPAKRVRKGPAVMPAQIDPENPDEVREFKKTRRALEREEALAQIKRDKEARRKTVLQQIAAKKLKAIADAEEAEKRFEAQEQKRIDRLVKEQREREAARRERESQRAKEKAKRNAELTKIKIEQAALRAKEKAKRDADRDKMTKEAAKKIIEFSKKQAAQAIEDGKIKAQQILETAKAKAEKILTNNGREYDVELVEAARLMKGKEVTFIPQGQKEAIHGTIRGAAADKRTGYVFYRILDKDGNIWRKNYHSGDIVIKP